VKGLIFPRECNYAFVDHASPSRSHLHHNLINIVRLIVDWLHTRSQMRLFIKIVDFSRKIFIRNICFALSVHLIAFLYEVMLPDDR